MDKTNSVKKTGNGAIDFAEVKETTYVIKKGKVACLTQFEIVYDMEWKQIDPPPQNLRFIPNVGEMEIYSITHGWLKAEKINNLERKDFLRIKCAD